MKSTTNPQKSTQGVDIENLPVPDLKTILQWLSDDLGRARSLLQAIHDNPNIKQLIAEHMLGQLENYHNAEKLKKAQAVEN